MKNSDTRPNILLLQGEDIGRHLGCYGDPVGRTPHLDRLASEGVLFDNAFCNAPVCAPSRGGMATGCYPYSLGNHHMRSTLVQSPRHFVQELADAGYFVNWHSKLDFNFEPQEGWRHADHAWVETAPPKQPFFLYENFHVTHESRMFDQVPDWHGSLPPEGVAIAEPDISAIKPPPWLTDCVELRRQLVRYYHALSILDAQVGRRLQWLEEHGLAENTLVLFLSDHGRGLPREKRWCYNAGIHMPLVVRWPRGLKGGAICRDLVSWVDIAPTLLSLSGASIPQHYQGKVFLGEGRTDPRTYCFAGRDRMDEVFDRVRVVRTERWHYIRNFAPELPWAQCQTYMEQQPIMKIMREQWRQGTLTATTSCFFQPCKPEEELYDISLDPDCLHNLADSAGHANVLHGLREALNSHLLQVSDWGLISEEDLVRQGLVKDRLPEYRARSWNLAPDYRIGPDPIPLTLRELETLNPSG